jgi:alpha-beta hydrolase superfamily lysophospholipase
VTDAIKNMHDQGLPDNAPIFYGGHSLGSVISQDYLFNNSIPAAGLILTGGFLQV